MYMDNMKIKVYGKINLSLDVLGLYGGGFHELDMCLCSVDCYDTLEFIPDSSLQIYMDDLPADENNTISKVIRLAMSEIDEVKGGIIKVTKGIPMSAGMGGSSADASGTLYCLRKIYGVREDRLLDIARRVGSDVAYMLEGGFKRAKGKGEELSDLPFIPLNILVICPKSGMSTKAVFDRFDELKCTPSANTQMIVDAMEKGEEFLPLMYNALQKPAISLNPVIGIALDDMRKYTAYAMMSGSGSAVFGVFSQRCDAEKAADQLRNRYPFCRVLTSVRAGIEEIG